LGVVFVMKQRDIRLIIVTEDERFYLAGALDYFLSRIPNGYDVVSVVVLKYYYGKWDRRLWIRVRQILKVFGWRVLIRIVWRFAIGRIMSSRSVATIIRKHGIPILKGIENINTTKIVQDLARYDPDLIVAIGVNSLFRKPLRELARLGCINVHTGIRPQHRGRAAIFWALADGDTETGITVHYIDGGVDSGRTIATRRYRITVRSFDKLLHDLRLLSMDTLFEALSIVRNGNDQKYEKGLSVQAGFRPLPGIQDLMAFVKAGNKFF
jgi:methionyl-tRNA formyltransferase